MANKETKKEVQEVKAEIVKKYTVKQALACKTPEAQAVTCFKNQSLNGYMTTIATAKESGKKAVWKIAIAVHDIVASECFKDDFLTQKALADYLGFSKQNMTLILNASEYASAHTEAIVENYTLKRADIYGRLEKKKKLTEFNLWIANTDRDISSDAKLEAAYRDFRSIGIETKAKTEGASEGAENASEDKTEEVKTEAVTDEAGAEYVRFEFNGLKYRIPVQALKNYMEQ